MIYHIDILTLEVPQVARIRQMPVMVATDTHSKIKALASRLTAKNRRQVTIREVMDRAVTCLEDANAGGAWLSPQESWELMRERVQRSITATVIQVMRHYQPEVKHVRVGFNPVAEEMTIEIDGDPGFMVRTVDKQSAGGQGEELMDGQTIKGAAQMSRAAPSGGVEGNDKPSTQEFYHKIRR